MTPATSPGRRDFLRFGAAAGVAAVGVAVAPQPAAAAGVPDLFAGLNSKDFKAIQAHENSHVQFLVTALGSAARPKPNFKGLQQSDAKSFATVAQALENTGVGAYLGAAPVVFTRQYLDAAVSIAEIEARHAGYLNVLLNGTVSQNVYGMEQNFEQVLTIQQVVDLASPFVQDLNGGPALTFSTTPSRANDIAILNFALALEYLEAEFYNINVPIFFS